MTLLHRVFITVLLLFLSACSDVGEKENLKEIAQEREVEIAQCVGVDSLNRHQQRKTTITHNDTTPPTLTFYGASPLTLYQGDTYHRECALGIDDNDGQVMVYIVDKQVDTSTIGSYTILFSATDMAGNLARLERVVHVLPNRPVITLKGDQNITLIEGENYIEQGATAYDKEDGNISKDITITGRVDSSHVGHILLKYNVKDSDGNPADEVHRSITIVPAPTYTYGGSVSGLDANDSLVLQDTSGQTLHLTANSSFTFAAHLHTGELYDVTLSSAPIGKSCTLQNGAGSIGSSDVTDITLSCHPIPYTIQCTIVRDAHPDYNESSFEVDVTSTQTNTQRFTLYDTQNSMTFLPPWYYRDPYEISITKVTSDYPYFDFKKDGILAPRVTGKMLAHDLNLTIVPTYRIHGDASGSNDGTYKYKIINHSNSSEIKVDGNNSMYEIKVPMEYRDEFNLTVITDENATHGECQFIDTYSTEISGVLDENIKTIDIDCYAI